jgi:hypothetical protein
VNWSGKPRKLRDDSWGCAIDNGDPKPGDTVSLTSKAGKTWQMSLVERVWAGAGVTLWRTGKIGEAPPPKRADEKPEISWAAPSSPPPDDDIPF